MLDESLADTARREVLEETGIDAAQHHLIDWSHHIKYRICPRWRYRYAPGTTHNTEHRFGLLVNGKTPVRMPPREHVQVGWLFYRDTATRYFPRSNIEAILQLPERPAVYHAHQTALAKGQT